MTRALRLGNRLLGNAEGDAALEITLSGPTLKFNTAVQAVASAAARRSPSRSMAPGRT